MGGKKFMGYDQKKAERRTDTLADKNVKWLQKYFVIFTSWDTETRLPRLKSQH